MKTVELFFTLSTAKSLQRQLPKGLAIQRSLLSVCHKCW